MAEPRNDHGKHEAAAKHAKANCQSFFRKECEPYDAGNSNKAARVTSSQVGSC